MSRLAKGFLIGLLVSPVLGFLVATSILSGCTNEAIANYAWLLGLGYGFLPGLLVGPVIGALIGVLAGWSEGRNGCS
jgi:LytS/YehU family sensor histidine kinase